jgi:tetratricopeptide (TPR) repeat protein
VLAEAEKEAREAVRLSGQTAEFQRQLGDVLLREGKASDSIEALQRSIADDPAEVQAPRLLARAYVKAGQPALGAQVAAQAAKSDDLKQRADVLVNQSEHRFLEPAYHAELAELYDRAGRPDEAARERQTLGMLRSDPASAADSYHKMQAAVRKALGAGAV